MQKEDWSADQNLRYSSDNDIRYLMVRYMTSLSHSYISFAGETMPSDVIPLMYDNLWYVYVQFLKII